MRLSKNQSTGSDMVDPFLTIGGVGGSGTRIIAQYAQECGVWMGDDLNMALDNHQFGLVIKRPNWLRDNWQNDAAIDARIKTFQKLTSTQDDLSGDERKLIMSGLWKTGIRYHGIADKYPSPKFVAKRLFSIARRSVKSSDGHEKWGWKEPNTHMILGRLHALYPDMKYVHVLRHGFDMALSDNQQQVDNWAELFDLDGCADAPDIVKSYRYWVEANRRAMQFGSIMGPDKFLAIKFEDLCAEPEKITRQFIDFLDADVEAEVIENMISIPKTPPSVGRYRDADLSCFQDQDFKDLKDFGYEAGRR